MPLDIKLLNLLACPDCKLDLIYKRHHHQEELICPQCRRRFSVVDGIPHLLPKDQKQGV